jgi:carbon-monoxide dehydrogenase medium subunit
MGDGAAVGAMTSFTDILEHRELCHRYPVLAQAVRTIGSVQIRNAATLGGNLCNAIPCADGALPLLVLDARLSVLSAGGQREIPVDEFFVGPRRNSLESGEILATILIDPPARTSRGVFLKKTRLRKDLALASVAVHLELGADGETCRRVRVAAGSVAPIPLRLKEVERHLEDRKITAEILRRARDLAGEEISPITDIRASADYRRHITGVLLQRAVEILLGRRPA